MDRDRKRKLRLKTIWCILVDLCEATPEDEESFVESVSSCPFSLEYRFQGDLGFGGKIYMEHPPRVSCYKGDETPERLRMIRVTNGTLAFAFSQGRI